jgi:hypothetical protein
VSVLLLIFSLLAASIEVALTEALGATAVV